MPVWAIEKEFLMSSKAASNIQDNPDLSFAEFPEPDYQAWRTAVEKLLKGAPFEKKMVRETYEGITLQPIYRREDTKDLPGLDSLPGIPPYRRAKAVAGFSLKPWQIAQKIAYPTPQMFNEAATYDVNGGLTGIAVKLDKAGRCFKDPSSSEKGTVGRNGTSLANTDDLAVAFAGIDLAKIPVYFNTGSSALPFGALYLAYCKKQGLELSSINGGIKADPVGELAVNGELPITLDVAYDEMARLVRWLSDQQVPLRTIVVDSSIYHNSGGNAVQELAFGLATGVEYLREMTGRKVSVNEVSDAMSFEMAVGSNFFIEVAKLRAARILWAEVIKACGGDETAQKIFIQAKTSYFNKTSFDPQVNLLRATTEAFSAILGGCDSLHVGCFDDTYKRPDQFSRRLARNIQIILQEESHVDKIIDPAGGSWYIENLTDQLAMNAWQLFQQIEAKGGMIKALQDGFVQQQIEATAVKREQNIAKRKDVFVGANMYANINEPAHEKEPDDHDSIYERRIKDIEKFNASINIEKKNTALEKLYRIARESSYETIDAAIDAAAVGASLGEIAKAIRDDQQSKIKVYPLKIRRGPEMFEVLRKTIAEHRQQKPDSATVYLACFGKLSEYKPREDFSTGFFQVGGFEVKSGKADDVASGVKAAIDTKAPIVVICSSDDNYVTFVPEFAKALKRANPNITLVMAGYPKDQIENYQAAGVDDFIFLGGNVYELLAKFAGRMGVVA
jgi:methylmalonyl-CoA mutase